MTSAIAERTHQSPIQHIIMTSDESDPAWWRDVHEYGWYGVDHAGLETVKTYGHWYPIIIDVCC